MKKTLLGGTAVLSAFLLATGPVAAQDAAAPAQSTAAKLAISGTTTFHFSTFSQSGHTAGRDATGAGNKLAYTSGKGQGYNFSQDDSSLDFSASGRTDMGVDYLARINFAGQTGSDLVQNNYSVRNRIRQNYVQLSFKGFTIQGGDVWGTETTSASDGSGVMRGDGGFGGNWSSRFNEPFLDASGSTGNMVYGAYLAATSGATTKFTVMTPRVFGLRASMSLTPNTGHYGDIAHNNAANPQGTQVSFAATPPKGSQASVNSPSPTFDQNHQAYSLSFSESFGPVNLALSGAAVTVLQTKLSDPDAAKVFNKTGGYTVGGTVSYAGFDLGAGFYDNKKTGLLTAASALGRNAGKTWNVALGWSGGPYAFALGYLNGQRNNGTWHTTNNSTGGGKAKADIYSVTADCRLADGLTVYGDYNYATMKDDAIEGVNNIGKNKNEGSVFMLGTRINF